MSYPLLQLVLFAALVAVATAGGHYSHRGYGYGHQQGVGLHQKGFVGGNKFHQGSSYYNKPYYYGHGRHRRSAGGYYGYNNKYYGYGGKYYGQQHGYYQQPKYYRPYYPQSHGSKYYGH